ncbi:MAG TPA: NAD(P)H-dependent oxidoreductase [Methanocella sp.]|nr:NAD(P)H-dependent oxidoreductase [Methanocella sp.]
MKALLLVGSPRGEHSTSNVIGSYLMERLEANGTPTERIMLGGTVRSAEGPAKLLAAVDGADLLVLAFPLYIDSLPAGTTKALELIFERRKAVPKRQRLAVIVNSGFPDPSHNLMAVEICRKFAADAGMEWMGSVRVSMGGAVYGKSLKEAGGMVRNLTSALDEAAVLLAGGKPLTPEIEARASKPFMPLFMCKLMMTKAGGLMLWHPLAKANGVRKQMWNRPYQQ